MTTRIETLIDAVITNIQAEGGVDPAKVFRNRVQPLDDAELPAYVVILGPDEPLNELGPDNLAFIDWQLVLFVDVAIRSVSVSLDQELLDMRARVHRALMANQTQGQTFVITTIPAGSEDPIIDDSGERKNATYRTNWAFHIRTSVTDIEL